MLKTLLCIAFVVTILVFFGRRMPAKKENIVL